MERPRHVLKEPHKDPPEVRASRWVVANIDPFCDLLERFRAASHEVTKAQGFASASQLLDPLLRSPEEMPLCTVWPSVARQLPIPNGFQIIRGSVVVTREADRDYPGQNPRVDHLYLESLDGRGVIVDHCAPQFINRACGDIARGERLSTFLKRVGKLSVFANGTEDRSHTFLIGGRDEILAATGLRYDTSPRYES